MRLFSNKLFSKGLSDSKYYLIATIGNKLLAFLIIPIIAKSVGVEEFATYDLFLVMSTFLNIIIILGMDSGIAILLAESKQDKKRLSFLYGSSLFISASVLILLAIAFNAILYFTKELFLLSKELWNYIFIYLFFMMINYHTFNFLRWQELAKRASFINLFAYILGMLLGVLFLSFQSTITAYFQGLILGVALGALFALYSARAYLFSFEVIANAKALLKELFILSLPFIPNYLGNSLMQMADRFVILLLFSKYELGIYALIIKLAMIPQILIGTMSAGFLPVLYNNYKTTKGAKLIRDFFHSYLLFIPIAFLIAYLIKDFAIELFGGKEYLAYSYLFPLALVSILFLKSSQTNGFGYSIKRKTHHIIYITFFTVALNYLISLTLGSFIGLAGVVLGTCLAGVVRTYLYSFYSEKLYSFGYSMKLLFIVATLVCLEALLLLW